MGFPLAAGPPAPWGGSVAEKSKNSGTRMARLVLCFITLFRVEESWLTAAPVSHGLTPTAKCWRRFAALKDAGSRCLRAAEKRHCVSQRSTSAYGVCCRRIRGSTPVRDVEFHGLTPARNSPVSPCTIRRTVRGGASSNQKPCHETTAAHPVPGYLTLKPPPSGRHHSSPRWGFSHSPLNPDTPWTRHSPFARSNSALTPLA